MNVELVRKIREHLALNPWNMAKAMGKNIQSYQHLERNTKKMSISDFDLLYKLSGLSPEVFLRWVALEAEAKKKKIKKRV